MASQKVQTVEFRSAERGLVTAVSDRDMPANALTVCENLLVDDVAGRLVVRDAWDYYPTVALSRLSNLHSTPANIHKVWAVFEWQLVGAPAPIKVVVWTIIDRAQGGGRDDEYHLRISATPHYNGGWVTDSWGAITSQGGGGSHFSFGRTPPESLQVSRVTYENAIRMYVSYGLEGEDASTNPIAPLHLAFHKELDTRFGSDTEEPAELVLETGALLSHQQNPAWPTNNRIKIDLELSPGGGDVTSARSYRYALEYDGYQVGELSGVYDGPEPTGGGDAVQMTVTVPNPGAFPRRPTALLVFAAKTEDVIRKETPVGSYALVAKLDFVRGLVDVGVSGTPGSAVLNSLVPSIVDDTWTDTGVLWTWEGYTPTGDARLDYSDNPEDGTFRPGGSQCGHDNQWSGPKWTQRTHFAWLRSQYEWQVDRNWLFPLNSIHPTQDGGALFMANGIEAGIFAEGNYPNGKPMGFSKDGDSVDDYAVQVHRMPLDISSEKWPTSFNDEGVDSHLALGDYVLSGPDNANWNWKEIDGTEYRCHLKVYAIGIQGSEGKFSVGSHVAIIGRDENKTVTDLRYEGVEYTKTEVLRFSGKEWPGGPVGSFPVARILATEYTQGPNGPELLLAIEPVSDDVDLPANAFVYNPPDSPSLIYHAQEAAGIELVSLEQHNIATRYVPYTFSTTSQVTVEADGHFPELDQEWHLYNTGPDAFLAVETNIVALNKKRSRALFKSDSPGGYENLDGGILFAKVRDLSGGGGFAGADWSYSTDGSSELVLLDVASDELLFTPGVSSLVHRPYSEFATHGSEIIHARGAVACRVGDRVFLADVRLPSPDDPHNTSEDEEIRHQILYSSFSEIYPSVDSFPPANSFSVGEGTSRVVGMFEHMGRLVVLTETAAVMMMVQPGDFASVQTERVWAGMGGITPDAIARTPRGVAWLSSGGVYLLQGTEPTLVSAPINTSGFLGFIESRGTTACLFYRPRRETLHLSLVDSSGNFIIYTMSRNGAWSHEVFTGVDFASGDVSATGDSLGIVYQGGAPRLIASNITSSKDFGDYSIKGSAKWATVQPAGGDRIARVVAANLEHSRSTTPTLVSFVDDASPTTQTNGAAGKDRTRLNINQRGRNVSLAAVIYGQGEYVERASLEFIPKGRVRS